MNMNYEMSHTDLVDLGLTNAEAKAYLALLELGSTSVGRVIERSNLQSSVTHLALNNLVTKGFASYVLVGKKRLYQASSPKHFLDHLEERKQDLLAKLPTLLEIQNTAEQRPESIMFRGINGVKELLFELLEAGGSEHHTFGSTNKSLMLGEEWWVRYHVKRAKKRIKAKLLFNESLKYWMAEAKYPRAEVRYTKQGFEPLTETIIRNDCIGLIVWVNNPIGILLRQKEAADSYDQFFSLIWKNAFSR